jgi:hypothetical protein
LNEMLRDLVGDFAGPKELQGHVLRAKLDISLLKYQEALVFALGLALCSQNLTLWITSIG